MKLVFLLMMPLLLEGTLLAVLRKPDIFKQQLQSNAALIQTRASSAANQVAQQVCEAVETGLHFTKDTLDAVTEGLVATLVVTNQAVTEVCERTATSICGLRERLEWQQGMASNTLEPSLTASQAEALGNAALENVQRALAEGVWDILKTEDDIALWKLRGAGEFVCIKAEAILDAPVDAVYSLFVDNSRVSEYNDHCRQIQDLEVYPRQGTKITWSASGKYGPFKARDFCTLVFNRTLRDGTQAIVSQPWRKAHPLLVSTQGGYVRSEVLLSGHFLRAVEHDPQKTHILTLSQIDPGGGVSGNPAAIKIINALSVSGPVVFIKKLEAAAQAS